ncbi:ABC transporter permease [Spiribacter halobius]|uniref:Iron export ABC transporter permease subunit FetB n=1 Tax=Sediminicurvatus halobius TaxID=2182432 RepID=A0A2U2N9T3_9GAMM|nr:iron export ABC transporter permease subunit FetB [Spiribacter halobius]PWG65862.1 iron export ABC transporter permease subunit FetB [Spiribacter halobius]UEX77909.1 iron export ABC transporter permease subunit FetB [Spiribacter halobius]
MSVIAISWWELALASVLVGALAACTYAARLAVAQELVIAAVRTVVQLALVGFLLETLFSLGGLHWVALMGAAMLVIAGREVTARQKRRFSRGWTYGIGTTSMFLSSFSVTVLALTVLIGPNPWYTPQYAIPLLGMMLGNTMTGVAVALDRLTDTAWQQREMIEARLMLGQPWSVAIADVRRDAMRAGMIPTINAMAAAGVVSLPGMMTGQILAGTAPALAVKYQILVMFLITVGTGFGTFAAVAAAGRRLFDRRERLRLDRLTEARNS